MNLEHGEQVALVQWLKWRGLLFCAIPNAARRTPAQAAYLKAEGLVAGAPDLLVFTPPPRKLCRGIAIEMKRVKGGRTSATQEEWHSLLRSLDWVVIVAHGAGEAIDELTALGY